MHKAKKNPGGQPGNFRGLDELESSNSLADAAAKDIIIARHLAENGVPIFLAERSKDFPKGGSGDTGYWLPKHWQRTEPDPAVLDDFKPGMAVCAVMGHAVDAVDKDPRNGGDLEASLQPKAYGIQSTPSGGTHELIASLGVRSKDGVLPGVDVKAGLADSGEGIGFIFIAPTERPAHGSVDVSTYAWTVVPDLDALSLLGEPEHTGTSLAGLIDKARTAGDMVAAEGYDGPAFEDLNAGKQAIAQQAQADRIQGWRDLLVDAATWEEGHRDHKGRGWEALARDFAWSVASAAANPWMPLTVEQAKENYLDTLPEVMATTAECSGKFYPGLVDKAATKDIEQPPWDDFQTVEAERGLTRSQANNGPTNVRRLIVQRASEIEPEPVRWLWEHRIAAGTLSLLAGREGLGKSTLAAWIAARVTRGQLPGDHHGQPRAVIVAATEDSWKHTLVPRFMAAGADMHYVLRIDVETATGFTTGLNLPDDIEALGHKAAEYDVGLLILDPLMSRLDSLDTHKDAEVRVALEPLVRVADTYDMSILGLIHVNKSSNDPLNAVMGSKAFTAVARSVSTVVADPDDDTEQRRLFGTVKNNLAPAKPSSQVFTVETHRIDSRKGRVETGKLVWQGEVDTTIKAAMAEPGMDNRSTVDEAADWLQDYLEIHTRALRASVVRDASKAGFNESAIKRAAKKLGVYSSQEGYPRRAHWSLSAHDDFSPQSAQPEEKSHGESFFNELNEPTGSDKGKRKTPVGSVSSVSSSPRGDELTE